MLNDKDLGIMFKIQDQVLPSLKISDFTPEDQLNIQALINSKFIKILSGGRINLTRLGFRELHHRCCVCRKRLPGMLQDPLRGGDYICWPCLQEERAGYAKRISAFETTGVILGAFLGLHEEISITYCVDGYHAELAIKDGLLNKESAKAQNILEVLQKLAKKLKEKH